MAVKRSVKRTKAPIKRSLKRGPATSEVDTFIDENPVSPIGNGDLEAIDPTPAEVDYQAAPLTPEQQAEADSLEGANTAAKAMNNAIPERQAVERSAQAFKSTAAFQEFMALPLAERRKLLEEEQTQIKRKRVLKK